MQYLNDNSLTYNLYDAQSVRVGERKAATALGLSMAELMERAGQAVFNAVRSDYPKATHWLIVAGNGNNGGDAYVVARLAKQAGIKVTVCQCNGEPKDGDARAARVKFNEIGGQAMTCSAIDDMDAALCIDGLFGTGLNRVVNDTCAQVINAINELSIPTISIDIPSGVHADTGKVMGTAITATKTVTFVGNKVGLSSGQAKQHCGVCVFDDLGIGAAFGRVVRPRARLSHLQHIPPLPTRPAAAHKGIFGRVLCVGGGKGMSGAIRLTGEAALRTGAGLVKVFCHRDSVLPVSCTRPELMVTDDELEQALRWATVIALGPGIGQSDWSQKVVLQVMEHAALHNIPIVIDADALNHMAIPLSVARWPSQSIITPHSGEAARLLNTDVASVEHDRFSAAMHLQKNTDAVVLLKGAGSIIAERDAMHVCAHGNPGMATAGMGDVLTGIIAALIAQGGTLVESAVRGACVHAASADLCATNAGQRGMIASDVISSLRTLINP